MAKDVSAEIFKNGLLEHPAVIAWSSLQSACVEPAEIAVLSRKKKSAVYRLAGMGPGGSAIIAKRCLRSTAAVEATIYSEVLSCLPVTALHFYGLVEGEGPFVWLFFDDAGDEAYSSGTEEHRILASVWLARLHTSTTDRVVDVPLPDRGPRAYLEHLRTARDAILRSLANPALTAEDVAVLKAIVAQCNTMESHWSQVARFCDAMPQTLVHGDFVSKNLRVRTGAGQAALIPLDWEIAGWGIPAADLAECPDLQAYWSVTREFWPDLDIATLERLAQVGAVFRRLAAINWASLSLPHARVERVMRHMRVHESSLGDLIRATEWQSETPTSGEVVDNG